MNVLVLAPYRFDSAPGQRFRIEQWMPHLMRLGVRFHFDAFSSRALETVLYRTGHVGRKAFELGRAFCARALRLARSRRYDAVFLHREAALIGPALLERLLHALGVPVVYDFDDALWVPYKSPSNSYLSYLKFPGKTATLCRLAAHVLAGNDYLATWAARHSSHVTVVPTTIDLDRYPFLGRYTPQPDEAVIGWTGSHSSMQYLDLLAPALQQLAAHRRFRLEIISDRPYTLSGVRVHNRPWRAHSEAADLASIDIGVMPVPDEPWARGKCACKALQYMALGIPTVVSPVGVNQNVIQHGENGLHARTTAEWVAALNQLLDDADLRERLGRAGRDTVAEAYSAQVHAPRVFRILERVASRAYAHSR